MVLAGHAHMLCQKRPGADLRPIWKHLRLHKATLVPEAMPGGRLAHARLAPCILPCIPRRRQHRDGLAAAEANRLIRLERRNYVWVASGSIRHDRSVRAMSRDREWRGSPLSRALPGNGSGGSSLVLPRRADLETTCGAGVRTRTANVGLFLLR